MTMGYAEHFSGRGTSICVKKRVTGIGEIGDMLQETLKKNLDVYEYALRRVNRRSNLSFTGWSWR